PAIGSQSPRTTLNDIDHSGSKPWFNADDPAVRHKRLDPTAVKTNDLGITNQFIPQPQRYGPPTKKRGYCQDCADCNAESYQDRHCRPGSPWVSRCHSQSQDHGSCPKLSRDCVARGKPYQPQTPGTATRKSRL